MEAISNAIRPLPPESQAQIRSAVVITSLNDVILGLLENVLDAGATSAEVRLDYLKGYCSVTDNGIGIPAEEFTTKGRLGSLHCTSKHGSTQFTYGRYGRFIHHLAALSLVNITSRQRGPECSLTFHRANVIVRSTSNADQVGVISQEQGCQVMVNNLFGDIPVRYKHVATRLASVSAVDTEFAVLKKCLVALLLACGRPVDVKVTETRHKQSYRRKAKFLNYEDTQEQTPQQHPSFDLSQICSTLQEAGYVDFAEAANWKLASAMMSNICIKAAVSLSPAPSKEVQFISLGNRPLHTSNSISPFIDEINSIFEYSSFSRSKDEIDISDGEERYTKDRRFASDKHATRQLNGQKRRVDRWPMFYVRIDLEDKQAATVLQDFGDELGSSEKLIEKILNLLRSLFHEFLSVHHFRPKARERRKSNKFSLNSNNRADFTSKSNDEVESPVLSLSSRAKSEPLFAPKYFDVWSRVKTGSLATVSKVLRHIVAENKCGLPDLTARLQTPAERVQLAQNALGEAELQSLDDTDLEALVDDFRDEDSGSDLQELDLSPSHSKQTNQTIDEPAYLWTSPSTGIEHKINARNGFIVPQTRFATTKLHTPAVLLDDKRPASAPIETTIALRTRSKPVKTPADMIASIQQSDLIRSFRPFEQCIPSIALDNLDAAGYIPARHDCEHPLRGKSETFSASPNFTSRDLRKIDLERAEVLAQVDDKFILIRLQLTELLVSRLVLIDQHAADERIKVEQLYAQLCAGEATTLSKPSIFEVSQRETVLFKKQENKFRQWQILYDVQEGSEQIVVKVLPSLIAERCRLDPKLLIDLLRREIHNPTTSPSQSSVDNSASWIHRMTYCPAGLVDMINSRACRSAIMFNDVLDKSQCEGLVRKLVRCVLPFQCAHGRPSCVMLPSWDGRNTGQKDEISNFAESFTAWKS